MSRLFVVGLLLLSNTIFAADGSGKITSLTMAAESYPDHPNVAQFKLEGGFFREGCNSEFAAVHASDTHLVSLLLAAKFADRAIDVHLNPADIYYNMPGNNSSRCIAYLIELK